MRRRSHTSPLGQGEYHAIKVEKHLRIKVVRMGYSYSGWTAYLADNTRVEMKSSTAERLAHGITAKWTCQRVGPDGNRIGERFEV